MSIKVIKYNLFQRLKTGIYCNLKMSLKYPVCVKDPGLWITS